ncbi:hypothetical protein NQ318_021441 [Aromia moschata]|uniref:Cilia- and flagella-associated protein 157 n=1 Tax=Aromia moschata TaxID=1265417 RepID=A0AAV8ZDU0_9CUCU|nr:hypothetical protein NQ318_021441 [Aromia moschata]
MEAKIRDLSTEFHDTTEMRIAATTHRVIRENVAVNNELDLVLAAQQRLYNDNCRMKRKDINLKQQCELLEVEKQKALSKVKVQLTIIEQLTGDHKFMVNQVEKYKHYEEEVFKSRNEVRVLEDEIKQLKFSNKILEQNLHHVRCDRTTVQTELMYVKAENDHLVDVLKEATCCIKEALTLSSESDTWLQASRRENLLSTLFTLPTIDSIEATYQKGDLGFVPKPVELRSTIPTTRNMESQTATSFQEYLDSHPDVSHPEQKSKTAYVTVEDVKSEAVFEIREEHPSDAFFDETEMMGEEEGSQDIRLLMLEEEEEEVGTATPATESHTEGESPERQQEGQDAEDAAPAEEVEGTSPPEEVKDEPGTDAGGTDVEIIDVDAGQAVETEKCGKSIGNDWECFYGGGASATDIAAEIPEVQAEVGPYCRCGCVVHLGQAKPRRLLATSSQSCPGRTFWLIQADDDFVIQFRVEQFHLPCGTQWLKVRDGNSLSSNLLADLSGVPDTTPAVVNSTGSNLLLEFFSEETSSSQQICGGGFLAHASQLRSDKANMTDVAMAHSVGLVPAVVLELTAVHIATIFFLSGLLIATALLGAQYLFRYRKYHVAGADDQDSLADTSAGSKTSLPMTTRASSNATLLSEVISLTKLRPHIKPWNRHVRLRESMDCESTRNETEVTLAKEEDSLSVSSTATLTQPECSTATAPPPTASDTEEMTLTCSLPTSPHIYVQRGLRRSPTMAGEKDGSTEKGRNVGGPGRAARRLSNVSNVTLTNGCYSSAANMISTATIRSTNAKETKDKRNREKLLAGPTGSDFSIAAQDNDLELDYYDYNVTNAGAAPGSYLGMDPAFLVWIPPLDESGEILPEEGQEYHEMQDIRPKVYIDPGSNKESPEEEMLLPKPRKRSLSDDTPKSSPRAEAEEQEDPSPRLHKPVTIQMHDFPKKLRSLPKLAKMDMEKETKVEKSPSFDGDLLDDIKFADEEDEDLDGNQCNIDVSYQDSNILSSS